MTQLDQTLARLRQNGEIVFVQHQGHGVDFATRVLGGACAALAIKWASDVGRHTYNANEWRQGQEMYNLFAVPADTPIGRKFPQLTAPGAGHAKVANRAINQMQYAGLAATGPEQMTKVAKSQGRMITPIATYSDLAHLHPADVIIILERYESKYRGGVGVLDFVGNGKGHAVAFQLAGSLARFYDPNAGEFDFKSRANFHSGFSELWDALNYSSWAITLSLYQVY